MTRQSIVSRSSLVGAEELIASLKAVGLSVKGTTRKAVRAGSKMIQADAERNAAQISHRRGQNVRINISSKSKTSVTGSIGPAKRKWYLRFAETGTKPHAITIRRRGGKPIRAYTLRHPGSSARKWLLPAYYTAQSKALEAFGAAMVLAIETKQAQIDNGPAEA